MKIKVSGQGNVVNPKSSQAGPGHLRRLQNKETPPPPTTKPKGARPPISQQLSERPKKTIARP